MTTEKHFYRILVHHLPTGKSDTSKFIEFTKQEIHDTLGLFANIVQMKYFQMETADHQIIIYPNSVLQSCQIILAPLHDDQVFDIDLTNIT